LRKKRPLARTRVSGLVLLALCSLHTILRSPEALAMENQATDATKRISTADVTGNWEFSAKTLNDFTHGRLTLKVDGANISGTLTLAGRAPIKVDGTITGNVISVKATRNSGLPFGEFTGAIEGDSLRGTGSWPDFGDVTWSAKRAAQAPSTPQVHDFEPKEFHRVFSDAIPPVLRVFPRDTVRTRTVDAGGVDSKGVRRSLGGNPQTGPFYIEGAMPGDTLVVRLTKVRLNRDSARSGSRRAS
jgi:amidase